MVAKIGFFARFIDDKRRDRAANILSVSVGEFQIVARFEAEISLV